VTAQNSDRRLLIAQISDLHIKPVGLRAYQQVDTAAALARCVDELNRFKPRPDLVVISGDLVDAPSKPAYDHLLQLLAKLEIPFAAIPGNHDDRDLMRAALPDGYAAAIGPLHATRMIRDVDIVLIDSIMPGRDYGMLEPASLAWLEAILRAAPTRPALIFMHHPPFVTGIGHMDVQNLRNASELAPILRRHRRARLVAAGHVHRAALTSFAGIAATICPAPNHAVALDLDGRLPPSFTIEPPAFHLHVWLPDNKPGEEFGTLVTHWVPIGDFDGPYRFFDDHGALL
jgi:3',5'-cyclic AMP phosphodiesterase CpdA